MADTAAHWVDNVLPQVPVRQWVISFPPPLRFLLAYDAVATSAVLGVFLGEVFRWLRRKAKRQLGLRRLTDGHPGAVTVTQRAGGSLNLNLHAHSLVLDGVFVRNDDGEIRFHALPAPDKYELAHIGWQVCLGTQKVLRKLGRDWELPTDEIQVEMETEPLLADCAAASMQNLSLLSDRAGQRLLRLGTAPTSPPENQKQRPAHGFDLHAAVRIPATDRSRLERLCRYILRPPIAHDRLTLLDDGRVRLTLKRPWSDGTSYFVMHPLDLIARLVPLVPPPRVNQIRYHGVLAPNAKLRPLVVPQHQEEPGEQLVLPLDKKPRPADSSSTPDGFRPGKRARMSWAKLLNRTMDFDMETCPECGAQMKIFGFVLERSEIDKLLDGSGESERDRDRTAHLPRGPPKPWQRCFGFVSRESSRRKKMRPQMG